MWNAHTGELYHTLRGHATEIVCLSFNPQGTVIATGYALLHLMLAFIASDDKGQIRTGMSSLAADFIAPFEDTPLPLARRARRSMDNTAKLWDVETGAGVVQLQLEPRYDKYVQSRHDTGVHSQY